MVLKRPFSDDKLSEISCKLPRQLECSNQMTSFIDSVPSDDIPYRSHISSGEDGGPSKSHSEGVGAKNEFESSARGSISSLSWGTRSPNENDSKTDAAVHLPFFPGFLDPDQPTRTFVDHKEMYSSLVEFTPRRLVSVGPNHQADIPEWGVKNNSAYQNVTDPSSAATSPSFGSELAVNDDDVSKMMGTCVVPRSDSEGSFIRGIGEGRTDCSCLDEGSIRCVRQHILEAREKLRGSLGHYRFVELGFCNMGEEVARTWSEEEEQVFHEVVFSYPASLGKNFWNHLSTVFPARSKQELVSYYFNVFMLRKRGVQNKVDPLNIDSDNDEWQGSEDGDDESGTTEYEDSVVESPVDQDNLVYREDHCEHFCEDDEGEYENYNEDSNTGDDEVFIRGKGERQNNGLQKHTDESPGDASCDPANLQNFEDRDIQDDSCTSYECHPSRANSSVGTAVGTAKQECRVESDHHKHLQGSFDELGVMGYDEFGDPRVWDVEYLRGPKTEVDFLPTCNMIKEVFGDEAWNNKGRDNKSIS